MSDGRLLILLESYIENRLTEAERLELQAGLVADHGTRLVFWEYMQQHALVGELLAEHRGRKLALGESALPVCSRSPSINLLKWTPRRTFLTVAAAAAVLLVATIVYLVQEAATTTLVTAKLDEVQGEVYIATDAGLMLAHQGQRIYPGQKVKTGGTGSLAVVQYADMTRLELGSETVVHLRDFTSEKLGKSIFLEEGTLVAEVARQPEGRPMLLSTLQAEARAPETRFRSTSLPGKTLIELETGRLTFTRKRDGETVEVDAGTSIIADMNDQPLEAASSPAQIKKMKEIIVSSGHSLLSSVYTANGKLVVSTANGWMEEFSFLRKRWRLASRFQSDERFVRLTAVTSDAKLLAAGDSDGQVKVWDNQSREVQAVLKGYGIKIHDNALDPDGKIKFGAKHFVVRSTPGGLAFSPDDKTLAVVHRCCSGYEVKLWDVETWKTQDVLAKHPLPIGVLAFSPDGKTLVTASKDITVRLWDLATKKERGRLEGCGQVESLAISPDGRLLATAGHNGNLKLWDAATGKLVRSIDGLFRKCFSVAFSPDGRILATGNEGHASLWDVSTGRELVTFRGHSVAIFSVAFSPDGKTLATAGWERYTRFWDVSEAIRKRPVPMETTASIAPAIWNES